MTQPITDPAELARRRAAHEADMRRAILRHGWTVQAVFPRQGHAEDGPEFAYTIGLAGKGLPELIVFALPDDIAYGLLDFLAQRVVDTGRELPAGFVTGLPGGADEEAMIALEVTDTTRHLTIANAFYGTSGPVRAMQLVWKGAHGLWPWSPGVDGDAWQPILGPRPDAVR